MLLNDILALYQFIFGLTMTCNRALRLTRENYKSAISVQPASKKLEFLDQLASRAGGRTGTGNGGDSPKAGGSRRGSGGALHESPHASAARSGREGTVHSSSATGSGQHSPKVAHTGSSKEPPSAFDTLLRLEQKEREAAHGAARDRDEKERRSSLGSPKAALAEREPPAGAARKEPPWKDRDVQYKFRERDFALERDAYKRHPKAKEKKKEEKKEKLKDSLEMSSDEVLVYILLLCTIFLLSISTDD